MKYAYFPGCSLKGSGRAFEESMLRLFEVLGIETEELADWNCCGATACMSVEEENATALVARNLDLADATGLPLAVPCAGCFGVLLKLGHGRQTDVRHPLQILAQDLGPKAIRSKVKRPLKGLKVASYYGCRLVRPAAPFDDRYAPQTMDTLFKSVGARLVDLTLKTTCCGGSLTSTVPPVGLAMSYAILHEAQRKEADVIATACPLCQFNLECYQDDIRRSHPELKPIPIVYFTQLLGLALGLDEKAMALDRQIIPLEPVLRERGILASAQPAKQPAAVGA